MQIVETFPLFVLLALTADGASTKKDHPDGASTKKQLHRNAIDILDENALIDHLKTLFPSKEEVALVEGRVAAIEGLNLGDRLCQIGQAGCWSQSACGMTGYEDTGSSRYQDKSYKQQVTFPKPFSKKPSVQLAMHAAVMVSGGDGEDYYGWDFNALSVTSTGFEFEAVMHDRKFHGILGIWIACTD